MNGTCACAVALSTASWELWNLKIVSQRTKKGHFCQKWRKKPIKWPKWAWFCICACVRACAVAKTPNFPTSDDSRTPACGFGSALSATAQPHQIHVISFLEIASTKSQLSEPIWTTFPRNFDTPLPPFDFSWSLVYFGPLAAQIWTQEWRHSHCWNWEYFILPFFTKTFQARLDHFSWEFWPVVWARSLRHKSLFISDYSQ